jgi:hypothetical protein
MDHENDTAACDLAITYHLLGHTNIDYMLLPLRKLWNWQGLVLYNFFMFMNLSFQ